MPGGGGIWKEPNRWTSESAQFERRIFGGGGYRIKRNMLYVTKMKRVVARNSRTLPMVISPQMVDSYLN